MGKQNVYDKLMGYIGNVYGVIGLMANIQAESNFNSMNMQNSYEAKLGLNDVTYTKAVDSGDYTNFIFDRVGYGLCQWTSSGRKAGLLAYAQANKTSIGDEDMQIDFIMHELSTGYKAVLKVLQNATSIKEASDYVCKKYERPADQSESALKRRADKGITLYAELVQQPESEGSDEVVKNYVKGKAIQMTKNFKSTEFDCSGKNCCSKTPIHTDLVKFLQMIRDHFGVSVNINSGYRCPSYNNKVSGASKNSWHMQGYAADIVVKGVHPMQVARFIETIPDFKGRIGCYSWDDAGKGFVHIDVRGTNSRGVYTENNTNYDTVSKMGRTLKRGDSGRDVLIMQRRLKKKKYYTDKLDGKFGKNCEAAVTKWNKDHYRPDDGVWGPKCWQEAFPI